MKRPPNNGMNPACSSLRLSQAGFAHRSDDHFHMAGVRGQPYASKNFFLSRRAINRI
jgi:hypothetical protein